MNRLRLFLLVLASGCSAVRSTPQPMHAEQSNEVLSLGLLERLSQEARAILENAQVGQWCQPRGRQIALAAYNTRSRTFEVVKIGLCLHSPRTPTTLTDGYSVRRLAGGGITRFVFDIHNGNRDRYWFVLGKHWDEKTGRAEYYYPYADYFLRPDIVLEGNRVLVKAAEEALEELRNFKVFSSISSEKLVSDMVSPELLVNIALIEQMDDSEAFALCPDPQTLPEENRIYRNCTEYAAFKAFVHYARNKENAFRFVSSVAAARGAMQFTRPTYQLVRDRYQRAELIEDFELGTQNLRNSLKAAACLLDLELASLPEEARKTFLDNGREGGLYPIIAYNGGGARAMCVWRNGYERNSCRASTNAWRQTLGYIAKYKAVWQVIDAFKNLEIASQ